MVSTKEFVEEIVEKALNEKIKVIEDKLRNSFKLIKKDNMGIMNSISSLREILEKEKLSDQIREIKSYLNEELKKFEEKVNNNEKIVRDLEKKLQKSNIKKELEKELSNLFNKRIDLSFSKQKDFLKKEIETIGSEINLTKTSFRKELDDLERKIQTFKELLEEKIEEERKKNEEEKQDLIEDFKRKLFEIEEERKKEFLSLKGQISYLKGQLNLKKENQQIPKENNKNKKQTREKGFFSKIVNSLTD